MTLFLQILTAVLTIIILAFIIKHYLIAKNFSLNNFVEKISELMQMKFNENGTLIKDEFSRNRIEYQQNAKSERDEISKAVQRLGDDLSKTMMNISTMQKNNLDLFADQLQKLIVSNEQKFANLETKVTNHLKDIQASNESKLEQMRKTVDEKLHDTLEKRLGESFRLVSNQLDIVSKGLGEMKSLATGVGDLKKVLSNVKTRGTWGEVQLENIIEQILTGDQFSKNVATKKGSNDKVEFAIKLPGRDLNDSNVWLPIDAKFPLEDYQRLVEAQEAGNSDMVVEAGKALESHIKLEGKKISDKYLDPPYTTDFAIMFLPVEGLYAEVLRRVGLTDKLQRENRIIIAGPTTISAILNSLQMGFRTLAIEKRSSEVWKTLSVVKTEFNKFGEILEKTQKKIQEASNTIESASKATRKIEKQLQAVESAPEQPLLLDNFEE
ncbi:MAG: DNA recombination protein RmuC [Ignavibacteriales bacterium CG_4_9_14_3_um_filter_34_10]|nr:MAG: DNA recombination protein RmuC [Ignavibacteriales bacterium CG_4_9_14_3_um_filter_34_10]